MALVNLIDKKLATLTIDAAKNGDVVDAGGCESLAFQLVCTAASAPVGISATLQRSNDGTNWVADGSATNLTGNGVYAIEKLSPAFKFYRLAFSYTSGSIVVATHVVGKGSVN
jgi:hypothetical protein